MKFKLLLSFFLFVSLCNASAQQIIHVTFQLSSPELSDDSSVYITGGNDQLGLWDPAKVKMQSEGNHQWKKEIELTAPAAIKYKYTRGSWDREGANANGVPLNDFSIKANGDTVIHDVINFWKNGGAKKEIQGQITGTVKYHRDMKGQGIKDRDLIVWLPPGYDNDPKKRYPVVYMQDGENIVDPATSSFGVDWRIDESCDSLIKIHAIQPVIVVGIYNTADRSAEYTPGALGTAYMNFVVNKVKPFIDSAYRTMPDRKHTIVGGSSAGGTISFMLAWEHPDIFSTAICMSPAFKIEDIDLVKTVNEYHGKRKKVYFYIDNGGIDLEKKLQPGVDEMMVALNAQGYKMGKDYVFISAPNARHSEASWSKRFPYAIEWCLSGK